MSKPHVMVFEELGGPYVSLVIEVDRFGRMPTADVSGFSLLEEVFFAHGWQLEHESMLECEPHLWSDGLAPDVRAWTAQ